MPTTAVTVPCCLQSGWSMVFRMDLDDTRLTIGWSTSGKLNSDRTDQIVLSEERRQEFLQRLKESGGDPAKTELHQSQALDVDCWRDDQAGTVCFEVKVKDWRTEKLISSQLYAISPTHDLRRYLRLESAPIPPRLLRPAFGL